MDKIYEYLKREKPITEHNKIKDVLAKCSFDGFINDFIEYLGNYIKTRYDYPKSYFCDSKQLDLLLNIFTKLFKLEEDTKKRDF